MDIVRLRGIGVSPGVAMGEISLKGRIIFTSRKETIAVAQQEEEILRLKKAVEKTRVELVAIQEKIREKAGKEPSIIFDAHLMILDDKALQAGLEKTIREDSVKTEWALSRANQRYQELFDAINDDYFKMRKADISDVLAKIYLNLETKSNVVRDEDDGKEVVLAAHDLLPSEAALRLSRGNVIGVVMDMGGQTSHTAILARSLNIPTIVGLHNITQLVKDGDFVIVDGTDGEVIVNPPQTVRKDFQSKKERYETYRRELKKTAKLASLTLDGVRFNPMANIELPEEAASAFSFGAEGIGLFRSEFIYLQSTSLPSEEDHLSTYSRIAQAAYPAPVYIRTIDIGGEKSLPQFHIEKEPNPALGLRAIRFSLKNKDLLRIQMRAILRASIRKNVRILIPMITEVEEIGEVKLLFEEVKEDLTRSRVKFDRDIPLGAMIEVPAAAAITDILIKELDYVSIGTNDLIQYFLAVDRSNEYVSYLYKPLHPAVLRLLRFIISAAIKAGKDVAVCGEMAADPISALLLLGMGLRNFSMNPIFIPRIKRTLRSVEFKTVKDIVDDAARLSTAQDIEEFLIEKILARHPKAFLLQGPQG